MTPPGGTLPAFAARTTSVPILWDHGQDPVGTMNAGWGGGWPNTASNAVANIQNRQAPFQLLGSSTIVAPTPFTSKFLAGNHYDVNTGTGGNAVMAWIPAYTPPAASWYTYMEAYEQHDPFWWFCAGPATIVYTGIYTLGQNTFSIQGGIPAFFTTGDGNQLFSLSNTVFTSPQGDPCFITAVDVTNNIVTMNKTALVGGTFGLQSVAYGDRDENCKKFDYTANQSTPYATTKDWYTANNPNAPKSNSAPDSYALGQDLGVPANPDNNGHSSSWGASNNPTNPAKGWNGWFKVFYAAKWSTGTDGFWQYGEIAPNGVSRLIVNYSGPTLYSGLTSWGESIGGYARNQGAMGLNPFLSSPASGAGVSGTFTQWRYYANAYYDRNPTTLARFYLTNSSTFTIGDGNPAEIQPYTSWATGLVTVKINQGNLANGSGSLWYVDEANSVPPTLVTNVSLVAAPVGGTFDYYISSTGSDSNAGTLASPWAITAINSKQGTYGGLGKKIGIVGGTAASPVTYNIQSIAASRGSGANGYLTPALLLDGGTSSNGPTVLSPCNSSGVYTRGAVIITQFSGGVWGNPNGNNGAGTARAGNPSIANKGATHPGWVTIDGLIFSGNISALVQIGQFGDGVVYNGVTIQNNEFTNNNGQGSEAGDNLCCISIAGMAGGMVQNNYMHDCIGYTVGSLDHLSGVLEWQGSTLNTYQFNTLIACGSLFGKESTQIGNILRYNYVDVSSFSAGGGIAIQDWSSGGSSVHVGIYGNILIGSQPIGAFPTLGGGTPTPIDIYGNSVIVTAGGDKYGIGTANTAASLTQHSNIIWNNSGAAWNEGYYICNGTAGFALTDYNGFYRGSSTDKWETWTNQGAPFTSYTTLAAFQTATGKEAHSFAATVSPLFVGSGANNAAKYQLQSGSASKNAGKSNGTPGGTTIDQGAWGIATFNGISQIGCSFAP